MSMCLCAHLHEIARQSGVVCRAIALLSQVERGAKVAARVAFAGCISLLCGAHRPCCCRATSVTTAGKGP